MNRNRAKRFVSITLVAADETVPKSRKSLQERVKDLWHGKEITSVEIELDGSYYCSLNPKSASNWTRLQLDECSHTVTLKHLKLKPHYPTVTVPAGYESYYYTAKEYSGFRIDEVMVLPPLPHMDFRSSPVTRCITERIVNGLSGGDLYKFLQSRQAWTMWLECWEGGVQLGFFSADENNPLPRIDLMYKDFCYGSPDEYDELCAADAISLEHYLMDKVKAELPDGYNIEIFYDQQFYGARYCVDVLGSPTTWELRDDFVEKWQVSGEYYCALHEYDVYRCQMLFDDKSVTIRFEGYGGERKQLPADRITYYAGQAYGARKRYTRLNDEESETLEAFLIRHLEDECKLISISPIPNYHHCYYIIDNRKLYYKEQEPYWAE